MRGVLIADTVPTGECIAAPTLMVKALSAYLQEVRERSLPLLQLPDTLSQVDWGQTWQEYAQLLESADKEVVAIAYGGSLGDAIDRHSTLADLCKDWRLSVLLTVPAGPHAVSVAAAYGALAKQANRELLGVVLIGETPSQPDPLASQIENIVRVPVVGYLSGDGQGSTASETLVQAAAGFNWELLPW